MQKGVVIDTRQIFDYFNLVVEAGGLLKSFYSRLVFYLYILSESVITKQQRHIVVRLTLFWSA